MKRRTKNPITRRQFLRNAVGALAMPMIIPGSALGLNGATAPSNRIIFGAIGIGPRAHNTLPDFFSFPEIQFLAVSDCRADRLEKAKQQVDTFYGNNDCVPHPDFRDLLARKDVDAVLIATGNRWHGLASIYAARAGKDIYSEKPITLTIGEGRALVETCQRFGTIYQAGTQRRSNSAYQYVKDAVQQGKIGRVHTVEIGVWENDSIPHEKPIPVPEGWNYEIWLGQSPWHPFVNERGHHWHYFWDTGEGMMTDMGCHYTDQMQWVLGRDHTGPVEFENEGIFPDPKIYCSDTPVTATAKCRYADGVRCILYQRGVPKDRFIKFIGDEGWIRMDEDKDIITSGPKNFVDYVPGAIPAHVHITGHIQNLVQSIRTRTPAACHPEVAHRATTICQAWTLSLRLGRKLKWDPVKERFDSEEANRMLWREMRAPWRV